MKWCGRIINDPKRIMALYGLAEPTNGKELQQFICALNWMRTSIPGYNVVVAPMQQCMEAVYKLAGGRTKALIA